jgi:uncharacterized cupin superfamily protein
MADTERPRKPSLIRAADRAAVAEESMSHPLNPASLVRGHSLSDLTGLERVAVHLLHVPPGKESFVYHLHHGEEEFVYVLAGRGIAEIDGAEHEVGPGDFLGFPTPSVAHNLRNPFDEDLVYLSGGERRAMEVADFPRLGKRLVRASGRWEEAKTYPLAAGEAVFSTEKK